MYIIIRLTKIVKIKHCIDDKCKSFIPEYSLHFSLKMKNFFLSSSSDKWKLRQIKQNNLNTSTCKYIGLSSHKVRMLPLY